jgi:methyl-accepting chemotaxis protein
MPTLGGIVLFTITLGWEIYKHGFDPVRILNIANFLLAWFIFVKIRTLKGFLHRVNVLLDQASKGDLEHRLVKEKEGGELGQMVLHLNYFLDVVEAFIREIITPLKYAGERKYWRKVVLFWVPRRVPNRCKNFERTVKSHRKQ